MITEIIDKYNSSKVWVIKKYKSGNYYINQKINGVLFYKKYTRTTKKHLISVLGGI